MMSAPSVLDTRPALQAAARALAAQDDDYARDENGVGFSQADTHFGHDLARAPVETWSQETTRAAWVMLRKYRVQLERYGVAFDDIVEPDPVDEVREVRYVDAEDGSFAVRFRYDEALVAAVRRLPQRRWDGAAKVWRVGRAAAPVLEGWAQRHGFQLSAAARALIDDPGSPGEAPPAGTVTLDVGTFELVIRFDYDPEMVQAVKAITGRRWDGAERCWRAPADSVREVRQFADQWNLSTDAAVDELPDAEPTIRPSIEVEGTKFVVRFPYDRDLIQEVRELPGASFDRSKTAWTVDLEAAVEVSEFVVRTGGRVGDTAVDPLDQAREALKRIEASVAEDADFHVDGLGLPLRPFQRAGVAYAVKAGRTFIADEMGLGKTPQALATLEARDAFPAVVVVPASVKLNWVREVGKFLPHRSVEAMFGRNPKPRLHWPDITVINYDILGGWVGALPTLAGLVFDESHYVKNPSIQRFDHAKAAVAKVAGDDPTVLLLSGTPATNSVMDFAPQLDLFGRLADYGGAAGFGKRYGRGNNGPELNRRMRASCYVRRLKRDVMKELPAKQWAELPVEGDADAMAVYRKAERDVVTHLAEVAAKAARDAGASDDEARKVAWSRALRASSAEHLVAITELRKLAGRAKMSAARKWVGDFTADGRKLVAFAHHKTVVDMLDDGFSHGCTVRGGMNADRRQQAVDRFQTDPDQAVIACALKAAGVGITLTAASDVLFLEQDWTPAGMDQAADRCHRIGQEDSVTAWVMYVPDTIDEYMTQLIAEKRIIIDAATDGTAKQELANGSVLGDLLVKLAEKGMAA